MKKAILFDLDGTLHHMDEQLFRDLYFEGVSKFFKERGYDKQLVFDATHKGVYAMRENDGSDTNENKFFNTFSKVSNIDKNTARDIFMDYYKSEYSLTLAACSRWDISSKILKFCRDNFDLVIMISNPVFPRLALEKRMNRDGIYYDQFDYLTTFDNSRFCKPNPLFFVDLMEKLNLKPEEMIVVGNNILHDAECARLNGIDAVLLKPDLILDDSVKSEFPILELDELIPYLKKIL